MSNQRENENEKDGYLIILNDGTHLEAIPNDDGKLIFDIEGISVSITHDQVILSSRSKAPPLPLICCIDVIVAKKISPPKNDEIITTNLIVNPKKDGEVSLKKCIYCDGKPYCATNGCINTPCGWICDD